MFSQGDIDKRGIKMVRDGKPAQLSDFREGDRLSATIITSKPPRVMTEKEVQATLANAPGGATAGTTSARAATQAQAAPAQTSAPSSGAPRTLPKTASSWPAVGLAGVLLLAVGCALTIRRRLVQQSDLP